jgi:hypothetical protein
MATTHEHPYRLVVTASSALHARTLEEAIDTAASDDASVAVVIPAILPATLPIWAAPARVLDRVSKLRLAARARMNALDLEGSVEVVPCRSVHSAISALCGERPPIEIVIAGSAPWRLRRAIRGLAPVSVVSERRHARRPQPIDGRPVLEP